MGVKLKDIIKAESINFKDLEGRTVSIDAFNTLYQFLSTIRQQDGRPLTDENGNITSHLSGILYRNSSMIEKGIKLVANSKKYRDNIAIGILDKPKGLRGR